MQVIITVKFQGNKLNPSEILDGQNYFDSLRSDGAFGDPEIVAPIRYIVEGGVEEVVEPARRCAEPQRPDVE